MNSVVGVYEPPDRSLHSVPARQFSFCKRSSARMHRLLTSEKWAIGIVRAPIHAFLDASFVPEVQWIGDCGPLDFLADCFGVVEEGRRIILAERFTYRGTSRVNRQGRRLRTGRGHITSISIDENGTVLSELPAIDSGLHMSYPYTIHDRDSWYVVAEELSGNRLNLYRRGRKGQWEPVKELLPHAVVDPTVFTYSGRWWMFGTTPEKPCSELGIWYADELEGDWRPHASNPVRNDLSNARSAGTPFFVDGNLYRPAQNNTRTYGGSIVINRVDVLTRECFEERPVQEVFPPQGSSFQDGIHTLSSFGDWTLIDAKRRVILPRVAAAKVFRRLGL